MSETGGRTGWGWLAWLALVLTVLTVVAQVLLARHLAQLDAERRSATLAARVAIAVADALDRSLQGATAGSPGALRLTGVGDAVGQGVTASVAVRARDSGTAVLDDAAGRDGGEGTVVVATYRTPTPPATVAERRAALTGLVAIPLALAPAVEPLAPPDGGIAVEGPHRTVLTAPADARRTSFDAAVPLAPGPAADWTVHVWTSPQSPGWQLWLVPGTLGMGALAAWLVARRDARVRRDRRDLTRLERASTTIAELTRLSQQSLDLAVVIPSVTDRLAESLGLLGVCLGRPAPQGEQCFYRWGTLPDADAAPAPLPTTAGPGETLALALARGGRTIAVIRVLPGRRLDRDDLSVLAATGDALAAALTNAEALAQQRELVARMRSVDELKTVFLATASHELRTPVAAISGFAELLTSTWDQLPPDAAQGYAERIHRNAQHLNGLVEDLLDFARLEGSAGLSTTGLRLDLGDEVGTILDDHRDLAPDHVVSRDLAPGLVVLGSRHALERIVTNLVGNAAKYSPAGGAIRVRVRPDGDAAELVVEDEGPGIAPEERDHVFSRFFRGSQDAVLLTRGAGLGLAIVQEYVSALGGHIQVRSAPGGGAAFAVALPRAGDASQSGGVTDA